MTSPADSNRRLRWWTANPNIPTLGNPRPRKREAFSGATRRFASRHAPSGRGGCQTKDSRTKASIRVTLPLEELEEGAELLKDIVDSRSAVIDDPVPDIIYSETDGEMYAEIHFWLETSRNSKEIKSDILEDFTRQVVESGLTDMEELDDNGN